MRKKIRKSEEEIKEEIMQMSPIEIKIETKYIIYFEDHGQDFLEWHIDKNGYVLDSRPFQKRIWTGKFTIPQSAQVGEKLAIWQNGESWVNYPIKEIKIINKNDVKSAEGEKKSGITILSAEPVDEKMIDKMLEEKE